MYVMEQKRLIYQREVSIKIYKIDCLFLYSKWREEQSF